MLVGVVITKMGTLLPIAKIKSQCRAILITLAGNVLGLVVESALG